ncbi:MAG: PIN domain-containing protein [Candidatus Limnocylindrales bacterium]
MTVLDAQALVAFLTGEPAAGEVAALLRDPGDPAVISAVNAAETLDVLVRIKGRTPEEVAERLDWLTAAGLVVVPVDDAIARHGGRLRAKHYDRAQRPVSMADCMALATALARGDRLATSDAPLATMARAEGCTVAPLADSRGARPR